MQIVQLIFLAYVVFLVCSFRKAALALFPFSLLVTTLPLIVVGPVVVNMTLALQLVYYVLFLIRNVRNRNRDKFPFRKAIILSCLAILLCALFGESRTPFYIIVSSLSNAVFPLTIWPLLKDEEDVIFITKSFVLALIMIVGYGIVEFVLQQNVWQDYVQSTTSVTVYHSHMEDIRFGYGRCSSLFDFPIPFGDVCAVFFCFVIFLFKHQNYILERKVLISMLVLCSLGVLLANSRASLVAYLIGFIFLFNRMNVKSFIFAIIAICMVSFLMGDYISANLASMSGGDDIGGSSSDSRMRQLEISFIELYRNPIFGGGSTRLDNAQYMYSGSYGLESVIFVLMIGKGLMGLSSYFYTYFCLFRKVPRKLHLPAFVLASSWVVAACLSLTTGVEISYPMVLILLVVKYYQLGLVNISKFSY